jgi:hypothetical protein
MVRLALKRFGGCGVSFLLLAVATFVSSVSPVQVLGQNESGGTDAGGCTLNDHIYTCNSALFGPVLARAQTVAVDVHNSDGVARSQLTALLSKKLGKTIAAQGGNADLIFLLIPTESGVVYGREDAPLGTLRVYSVTADGGRGHLLWAEAYSGAPDLPWPMVVRRLILQFEAHFKIK